MYTDPIVKKYIDLIKTHNGEIKMFYQGDPVKIPMSALPCCLVSKKDTSVAQSSNAEDEHAITLVFTIITDIRQELSTEQEVGDILTKGVSQLYEIVEGRDDDYKLLPTSLLGILRNNAELDTANNLRTDLKTITRIDYGQTLRQRNPVMWSVEARVEIVAHFIQTR